MFSVQCGVLLAICTVATAHALEQVGLHRHLNHTCTIIHTAGTRSAIVPDTWPLLAALATAMDATKTSTTMDSSV